MQGIKNALKGVQYSNPQLGERLYELCRKATSRHIDRPDEILNQQVVYMINSDMHAYGATRDAVMCLKRRLQMDHPQKQYLAIILTSKVLQECHAAIGMYQGELLQEVAYILRTQHTNSPAAARTRQAAMDALRHFGAGGVDAYRQARQQQGGMAAHGVPAVQRDPAAVAAERESLLDEITRLVEQAGTSTELLNELILNKTEVPGDVPDESAALRKELLSDVRELKRLLDGYMSQLAALSGSDAEAAMKKALEAVDQLDAALTLEKDVDAELRDLKDKGQLSGGSSSAAAPLPPPGAADVGSSSAAAAAAGAGGAAAAGAAAAAAAASKMQSLNLIDLDDEPAPAPAPGHISSGAADIYGPTPVAAPQDPFAPIAANPPAAATAPFPAQYPSQADPFAAAAAVNPAASGAYPLLPAAGADASDPFAALAAAPSSVGGPAAGFDPSAPAPGASPFAPFPPVPAAPGPSGPTAAAAGPGATAPGAASAGGADPFADAAPAWGAAPSKPAAGPGPAAAAGSAGGGFDSLATAAPPAAPAGGSAGGAPPAAAGSSSMPYQQQQLAPSGASSGGYMAAAAAPYGMPPAGLSSGSSGGYGAPYVPNPTGAGMTGGPYAYGGMPAGGYGAYGAYAAPSPYGMPMGQMGPGPAGMYPQASGGTPYGAVQAGQTGQMGRYPSAALGQQPLSSAQQQPGYPAGFQQQQQQQQQQPSMGGLAPVSAPPPSGYGTAAAAAPEVVLSPTNPFASVPAGAAGGAGSNPFGPAAGAGSNVDQEWNAFFARGQAAKQ